MTDLLTKLQEAKGEMVRTKHVAKSGQIYWVWSWPLIKALEKDEPHE